jgi:hypothetical protein
LARTPLVRLLEVSVPWLAAVSAVSSSHSRSLSPLPWPLTASAASIALRVPPLLVSAAPRLPKAASLPDEDRVAAVAGVERGAGVQGAHGDVVVAAAGVESRRSRRPDG